MKVVYRSFDGRYSDNPRALHEALVARGDDIEHVWMCEPGQEGSVPPGNAVVSLDGPDAVAALESAQLVVASIHLDVDWTKGEDATYLQMWHGTPLKGVHRDVVFQPESVPELADRDIARWDLLLSQNADAARLLPAAFGYRGPVAETGYPRNDLLGAPDSAELRRRVRAELGIPAGSTAVLYAPTWRDDEVAADGPDLQLHLDPARFAERLGPDHVLLVRLHHVVGGASHDLDAPGVVDVSGHPDVRLLYLAADVLVTDYSSSPFDFALTGKPIVYFTYDLEHYRTDLRPLYLDLEEIAPGPLLTTPDEVLDALHDLDGLRATYRDRYERFRERFCAHDDGRATDRVLDLVLPAPASTVGDGGAAEVSLREAGQA
ncbi:CDP-glycerol glycerophosphotransferase family protein [Geodermatophilus sp. SYSU D00815]